MTLESKTAARIEKLMQSGVPVLGELPEGWKLMGVYCGEYQWANNGNSRFAHGYEHALVRMEDKDGQMPG